MFSYSCSAVAVYDLPQDTDPVRGAYNPYHFLNAILLYSGNLDGPQCLTGGKERMQCFLYRQS